MRHKRILDEAADNPNAAVDELAKAVPSATPELVERVLERYGDPASDSSTEGTSDGSVASAESAPADGATTKSDGGSATVTSGAGREAGVDTTEAPTDADAIDTADETGADTTDRETSTDTTESGTALSGQPAAATGAEDSTTEPADTPEAPTVDPSEFTATERETLRAIQADPEATQRALAEELGVSAPTVSQRVNGIDGFEWSDRASFVATVFDDDATPPSDTNMSSTDTGDETTGESVTETLRALEGRVETLLEQQGGHTAFDDPELVSKIVRACMDAEAISEDEELRIIRTLMA